MTLKRKSVVLLVIVVSAVLYLSREGENEIAPTIFYATHSSKHHTLPLNPILPEHLTSQPFANKFATEWVKTPQGLFLNKYRWNCESTNPKALIFIVPGFAEHAGTLSYSNLALHLLPKYQVIGIDNQGHGRSTGYRGHVNEFDDYVHDLLYVIQSEIENHPENKNLPVYLFGHSMGSLICIRTLLLLRNPSLSNHNWISSFSPLKERIKGSILVGSPTEVDEKIVTPVVKFSINLMSTIAPKAPIDKLNISAISRNPEANARYENDPMVFRDYLALWAREFLATGLRVQSSVGLIDWPMMILHGSDDQIVKKSGAILLFENSSTSKENKEIHIFDGAFHDLLDEPVTPQVYSIVDEYLLKRIQIDSTY